MIAFLLLVVLSSTPAPANVAGSEGTEGASLPTIPTTTVPATYSGTATWCAPTPRYCQRWGGNAHLGAMRSFRWGDKPYLVRVTHGNRSTIVRVVSFCACGPTLIDLSPAAFRELAPLSRGRIPVTVTRLGGVRLPDTSAEATHD